MVHARRSPRRSRLVTVCRVMLFAWSLAFCLAASFAGDEPALIRSVQSGPWSLATTWRDGRIPGQNARVQIVAGHTVEYDLDSDVAIRSIHVAGTFRFATNKSTRLDVGLIKIQAGDDADELGFECEAHLPAVDESGRPALLVGTPEQPIPAEHTARIRLIPVAELNPESCLAIVCCGGRMEFHGAPLRQTWVKFGGPALSGGTALILSEPVPEWNPGDSVVLTATSRQWKEGESLRPGVGTAPRLSELRRIASIEGVALKLSEPLDTRHDVDGEVANLTRNVVVESAQPAVARGHTMYHRGSTGSISYAEFRHLGKEGRKGRYPIHFHLAGETMRGSSVVGASIWDSGNRWVTIHGTNRLVVRDCVGYQSVGHGFFLEDGSETLNVLDRNLAIQAFAGKPLPDQALAFDQNEGAGFWWANSLNTFTRNVAVECDRYGFRFEATPTPADNLERSLLFPDGQIRPADIRATGFIRFELNEAHAQLYGINLGEGSEPLSRGEAKKSEPFILHNTMVWDCLWGIRPEVPTMLVDSLSIDRSRFGIYKPIGNHLAYRNIAITRTFVAGAAPYFSPEDEEMLKKDRHPPSTVVTFIRPRRDGLLTVRGTSTDDVRVDQVFVNGAPASALQPGFLVWEIEIPKPSTGTIEALAVDSAGNREPTPHRVELPR